MKFKRHLIKNLFIKKNHLISKMIILLTEIRNDYFQFGSVFIKKK